MNALADIRYPTDRRTNNIADGLRLMAEQQFTVTNGDRRNVQNISILITDSRPDNSVDALRYATQAKNAGVRLFTIGVGNNVDMTTMLQMSSPPQTEGVTYWRFNTYNDLRNSVTSTARAVCSYSFSPAGMFWYY